MQEVDICIVWYGAVVVWGGFGNGAIILSSLPPCLARRCIPKENGLGMATRHVVWMWDNQKNSRNFILHRFQEEVSSKAEAMTESPAGFILEPE